MMWGSAWGDLQSVLDLAGKSFEERRQFLLLCVIRFVSRDGYAGQIVSQVGQSDRSQVGVLDGPPVALGRSYRHAQRDAIAFPWHDNGAQPPFPGGALLNRARGVARGA